MAAHMGAMPASSQVHREVVVQAFMAMQDLLTSLPRSFQWSQWQDLKSSVPCNCSGGSSECDMPLAATGVVVPSPIESYLLFIYMDQHDDITPAQRRAARKALGACHAHVCTCCTLSYLGGYHICAKLTNPTLDFKKLPAMPERHTSEGPVSDMQTRSGRHWERRTTCHVRAQPSTHCKAASTTPAIPTPMP